MRMHTVLLTIAGIGALGAEALAQTPIHVLNDSEGLGGSQFGERIDSAERVVVLSPTRASIRAPTEYSSGRS